jgi:CubicO group peptidase (beta-lactamase class C family)
VIDHSVLTVFAAAPFSGRIAFLATVLLLASVLAMTARKARASEGGEIAAALQPFVERQVLAGAVTLVATKDKVVDVSTVGYADIKTKEPMREDTLFWIASQTKPITGTALMMLVDEGKVKIEDPVEKYLPEFKGLMIVAEKDEEHVLLRKPSHLVTVREIMSHTSGMAFKSPMETPTLDTLSLKDAVRSHALVPLQRDPGTKYEYANAGINTAGRIIEVVSGMSYEEFLQKRIFDPLGMKDTTFWPTEEQCKRIAKSYKPNAAKDGLEEMRIDQLRYPLSDRTRGPMPAGGLFSTARDVGRFCQMILNGGTLDGKRYISEAALKVMTSKQTPESLKDSYGLGWGVGNGSCGHGGAYSTDMTVDFNRGFVKVFLVQHAGWLGDGGKCNGVFSAAAAKLIAKK